MEALSEAPGRGLYAVQREASIKKLTGLDPSLLKQELRTAVGSGDIPGNTCFALPQQAVAQ